MLDLSKVNKKPRMKKMLKRREMYTSQVDLSKYLGDMNKGIPVFGYPLLDYNSNSPHVRFNTSLKATELPDVKHRTSSCNVPGEENPETPGYKRKWGLLAKPILDKYSSSIPIGEILDKYNQNEENFKKVMNYFTRGRPIQFKQIKQEVKEALEESEQKEQELFGINKSKRK